MWQDYVNTGISIAMSYSLIPQVIKGFKDRRPHISRQTGMITSIGMYIYAYTAHTLGLDLSAATALATGTLWGILTAQSYIYKEG